MAHDQHHEPEHWEQGAAPDVVPGKTSRTQRLAGDGAASARSPDSERASGGGEAYKFYLDWDARDEGGGVVGAKPDGGDDPFTLHIDAKKWRRCC